MQKYKVTWLDSHGEAHEAMVMATNETQAERAVWSEEDKCLALIRTIQVD